MNLDVYGCEVQDCNNQGSCSSSGDSCECNSGWYLRDCSLNLEEYYDYTNLTMQFFNASNSLLNISSIKEVFIEQLLNTINELVTLSESTIVYNMPIAQI